MLAQGKWHFYPINSQGSDMMSLLILILRLQILHFQGPEMANMHYKYKYSQITARIQIKFLFRNLNLLLHFLENLALSGSGSITRNLGFKIANYPQFSSEK